LKAPWMSTSIEAILAAGAFRACLGSRVNLISKLDQAGCVQQNLNSSH